jgi:hypothetical protein
MTTATDTPNVPVPAGARDTDTDSWQPHSSGPANGIPLSRAGDDISKNCACVISSPSGRTCLQS